MFFQNVNSRVPETLQGLQVQRHGEPAPEIAKLLLRSFDPDLYLFNMRPSLFECANRLPHKFGDPGINRKNVEVWAVRIAVVLSRERIECHRRIVDGARDRPFEDERRVGRKRVRTYESGDAAE